MQDIQRQREDILRAVRDAAMRCGAQKAVLFGSWARETPTGRSDVDDGTLYSQEPRMVAGAFVLAGLVLGYWVHPGWFLFAAFVGLNLFQSAFTRFCPLESILRRYGVPSAVCDARAAPAGSSGHAAARGNGVARTLAPPRESTMAS
jgi:hypothetical protein